MDQTYSRPDLWARLSRADLDRDSVEIAECDRALVPRHVCLHAEILELRLCEGRIKIADPNAKIISAGARAQHELSIADAESALLRLLVLRAQKVSIIGCGRF